MERRALLAMLVLSIRTNAREINRTLELLNAGEREQTYPHTLERCFRTIEHDARVVGLDKFADLLADAKTAGSRVLRATNLTDQVELLTEVTGELEKAAKAVEAGQRHRLDAGLVRRLRAAAKASPGRLTPS